MDARKRQTQNYFDQISQEYRSLYELAGKLASFPSGPARMHKALRLIGQFKGKGNVLDAGCGTGHFAAELARRGYRVLGVDIAAEMIQQARKSFADKAEFRVGDVEKLDVPNSSVDAVACLGVLEYLATDDGAFSEMRRVLGKDGVAIVAFRNRLFNLFSLNSYTQQETAAGKAGELLAEFQEEVASCRLRLSYRELARQFRALRCQASEAPAAEYPVSKPIPVKLRQHTPRQAREVAARHGLDFRALLYFHFHPFPPAFEKYDPQTYNRLALAMEVLDDTPIGAAMASGFVCAFTVA